MSKWKCPKCVFRSNTTLEMVKHAIIKHNAKFTKIQVLNTPCRDKKLKQEVLELLK